MRRAAIFMADAGRRRVRAVGAHGTSFCAARGAAPDARQHADRAAGAARGRRSSSSRSGSRRRSRPSTREVLGITTLVCTPLSAAGRAYGVICADRGGGRFELSDGERHLLWTLGKTAALVATARNATRQQERTRRLGERLDLAREIHERVMQRLFGVSLALSAEPPLDHAERERCRVEMQQALSDLRRALERPLAPLPPETGTTLAAELERFSSAPGPPVAVDWPADVVRARRISSRSPSRCWPRRCATSPSTPTRPGSRSPSAATPTRSRSRSATTASAPGRAGAGMGLRLAAFEALQHGGVVEFGAERHDGWRVRLVVPLSGRRDVGGGRIAERVGRRGPPAPGSQAARARRRRPRRRPLGLPRAARRAAVGRALPGGADRRRGARADADRSSRTWRWSTCSWPASPARSCATRSARLAVDAGAADLRRRADVARRRARRRRLRVRLQGLGGAESRRRCGWSGSG